jgi:undecaprenyl-diphosphatase
MYQLDLSVLHAINIGLASSWLDWLMPKFTSVGYWLPVYIFAGILLIRNYRWRGVRMLVGVLLLVAFGDQLLQQVVKPLFDRLRPCADAPGGGHVVAWIRLPIGARLGPSFPSSHALNNFAVAVFFVRIFPTYRYHFLILILAALVAISRLYLGLHYPSDVLGGAVLGSVLGFVFAILYQKLERKLNAAT